MPHNEATAVHGDAPLLPADEAASHYRLPELMRQRELYSDNAEWLFGWKFEAKYAHLKVSW